MSGSGCRVSLGLEVWALVLGQRFLLNSLLRLFVLGKKVRAGFTPPGFRLAQKVPAGFTPQGFRLWIEGLGFKI